MKPSGPFDVPVVAEKADTQRPTHPDPFAASAAKIWILAPGPVKVFGFLPPFHRMTSMVASQRFNSAGFLKK
jgi:hypothetical protein